MCHGNGKTEILYKAKCHEIGLYPFKFSYGLVFNKIFQIFTSKWCGFV